jgi:hypothetical protein
MTEEITFELYDDENAPKVDNVATVYRLALDRQKTGHDKWTNVLVSVDHYQLASVDSGWWFGEKIDTTNHTLLKEIYEWLIEWEYAKWGRIGEDEYELFATEKLLAIKPEFHFEDA